MEFDSVNGISSYLGAKKVRLVKRRNDNVQENME